MAIHDYVRLMREQREEREKQREKVLLELEERIRGYVQEPDYTSMAKEIVRKSNLDEEEIKVGDEVVGVGEYGRTLDGLRGKVVHIHLIAGPIYCVEWEKHIGGIDCSGRAKEGHGWNVPTSHLKKRGLKETLDETLLGSREEYGAFLRNAEDKYQSSPLSTIREEVEKNDGFSPEGINQLKDEFYPKLKEAGMKEKEIEEYFAQKLAKKEEKVEKSEKSKEIYYPALLEEIGYELCDVIKATEDEREELERFIARTECSRETYPLRMEELEEVYTKLAGELDLGNTILVKCSEGGDHCATYEGRKGIIQFIDPNDEIYNDEIYRETIEVEFEYSGDMNTFIPACLQKIPFDWETFHTVRKKVEEKYGIQQQGKTTEEAPKRVIEDIIDFIENDPEDDCDDELPDIPYRWDE